MKIIKDISENEMIAIFLKAEFSSPRFNKPILKFLKQNKLDSKIIELPDINNNRENELRKKLLGEYRGYNKNSLLFENFPTDIKWKRVMLNKEELQKVKYINYDYWIELSNGSRLVKDSTKNIIAGKKIFNQSNKIFMEIANTSKRRVIFPELILVSDGINEDLVILEGHARITGYMLNKKYISSGLEVIIGFSKKIKDWNLY